MSWLYTIVFAGLMFSSNGNTGSTARSVNQSTAPTSESVRRDETEKFEQSYPLTANGRVSISNINGSITLEAWDRNEVKLEYTKTADTKERLADVEVRIDAKPDYFSVETDYGDWKDKNKDNRWRNGGKLNIDYHLMVPRGAVLNEIEAVNGSVTVSNFTNLTKVSAVNGSVNATNIRGTAKLSTVNGEVMADFDRLETGSKISLETVNGKAHLVIPSDANATLRADSLNGDIANDFGLPVRKGKYVGRDLYGRLGNGDVQIRLNSVNGGLTIGHKNDGKSLSPAVNLLPQKEKDDDDWDKDDGDDEDSMMRSAKIDKDIAKANKDISKSVKVNTVVTAKVMADAQVQINKIQPELAKLSAESVERAAEAIKQSAEYMESDEYQQKLKEVVGKQEAIVARTFDAGFNPSFPRIEKKSESFPVKGVPKVTVNAGDCAVTVRGWDKSEVQYRVVQISDPRNRNSLKVTENHSDTAVTIKLDNPESGFGTGKFFGGANEVRIEVFVPHKSNLKINSGGEIRLDGVSGDIDLTGGDESINVRDVDGNLQVSSSDGRIRVIGFKGDVVASSSSGMIALEGDFHKLKAKADDGAIFLTLPDSIQADLEATGDDVQSDGLPFTRVSGDDRVGKYRIGNGGVTFQVETEGAIRLRGSSTIKESL